jgi:hypothetical protein
MIIIYKTALKYTTKLKNYEIKFMPFHHSDRKRVVIITPYFQLSKTVNSKMN